MLLFFSAFDPREVMDDTSRDAGEAPHLETLWHHYAFGKPKETVAVENQVRVPIFALPAGSTVRVLPLLPGSDA